MGCPSRLGTIELPGLTVAQMLTNYQRDCEMRGAKVNWQFAWRLRVLADAIGEERAAEITGRRIRELQHYFVDKGYGNGSINTLVAVLKTALRLAALEERIPRLPDFPQRLRDPLPRQGFLEVEDYVAIREHLVPWAQDIFDFNYYTGWRKREILDMSWHEVDVDGGLVRLSAGRSKNRESRVFPIRCELVAVIERRVSDRRPGVPWVFHRDGFRVDPRSFGYHFKKARELAGRDGIISHDCRRTIARNMERARVPRGIAMKLLGHKTEAIYRRYAIVSEDELAGGAEQCFEYMREKANAYLERKAEERVPFERKGEARSSRTRTKRSGIYLRGKTWWLDFKHEGKRYVERIGRLISESAARDIAKVRRRELLKGHRSGKGLPRRRGQVVAFGVASSEG